MKAKEVIIKTDYTDKLNVGRNPLPEGKKKHPITLFFERDYIESRGGIEALKQKIYDNAIFIP